MTGFPVIAVQIKKLITNRSQSCKSCKTIETNSHSLTCGVCVEGCFLRCPVLATFGFNTFVGNLIYVFKFFSMKNAKCLNCSSLLSQLIRERKEKAVLKKEQNAKVLKAIGE